MSSPNVRYLVLPLMLAALLSAACDDESPNGPGPGPEPEPTCEFSLSATTFAFGPAGGSAAIGVSAGEGCAWTAQTETTWLSISSGGAGSGPGTVTFAAAPNESTETRVGALTVAGQAVTVTQEAAPVSCTYSVAPLTASFSEAGGEGSVSVTAPAPCPWTAASNAPWLTITGGAAGTGSGTVTYAVDVNEDPADREATIAVAGHAVAVEQGGNVGACEYVVSPVHFSPCMRSQEMSAAIATGPLCPWTATADEPWITIGRDDSGLGSGTIRFTVSDNYEAPRNGRILVRWPTPTEGQNLQVAQAGCRYAVSSPALPFEAGGGTGSFFVLQQSDPTECGGPLQNGCVWTATTDASWITITSSMPRAGDDIVNFKVDSNPSSSSRTATIVIRDQTVQITQSGS